MTKSKAESTPAPDPFACPHCKVRFTRQRDKIDSPDGDTAEILEEGVLDHVMRCPLNPENTSAAGSDVAPAPKNPAKLKKKEDEPAPVAAKEPEFTSVVPTVQNGIIMGSFMIYGRFARAKVSSIDLVHVALDYLDKQGWQLAMQPYVSPMLVIYLVLEKTGK